MQPPCSFRTSNTRHLKITPPVVVVMDQTRGRQLKISRRAQERRGEIYAENLLGHCQVQEINEEQEDEDEIIEINETDDDYDDMDGWKIPTSKSGHKVPKTFQEEKTN